MHLLRCIFLWEESYKLLLNKSTGKIPFYFKGFSSGLNRKEKLISAFQLGLLVIVCFQSVCININSITNSNLTKNKDLTYSFRILYFRKVFFYVYMENLSCIEETVYKFKFVKRL